MVALSYEEIDDALLDNCPRATALLQSCLLRDLGVPSARIEKMFAKHLA